MAENILKGTIKIDAPGVQKTFDNIVTGVSNIQKSLGAVPAAAQQATDGVEKTFSKVTGIDVKPIDVKVRAVADKVEVPKTNIEPVVVPVKADTESLTSSITNSISKVTGIDVTNKINTTVAGIQIPPVKVTAEVDKVDVPKTDIPPISVPVKVQSIEVPEITPPTVDVNLSLSDEDVANLQDTLIKLTGDKQLKIDVSADSAIDDVSKLHDGISGIDEVIESAKEQLSLFRKALKLATDPSDIANLTKGINVLQRNIKQMEKADNPLKSLHVGAIQAEESLLQFDRVIKYVSSGTGNLETSLHGLFESFLRLRTETGSTGKAFDTLLHELVGGGGLTLAVGLAIPLLVSFGEKLLGVSESEKEAAKSAREAREKILELIKSTDEIKDTATASKSGEIAEVQALAGAVLDQTKSYKERNRALEDLKEINKSYFGDLSLEESKLATLKSRVDEYTQAIVAQSVVKAFSDEIGNVSKELSKQELTLNKTKTAIDGYNKSLNVGGKEGEGLLKGAKLPSTVSATDQNGKLVIGLEKVNKLYLEQFKNVGDLKGQLTDLNGALKVAVEESLKFKPLTVESDKKDKSQKFQFLFDFLPFNPDGKLKPEQKGQLIESIDKFQKEFGTILQGAVFSGTENQRIKLAKEFDVELKAGRVKFNTDAIRDAFAKLNKDSDIIPEDTFRELPNLVVEQFTRSFQNESERIKNTDLFGDLTQSVEEQIEVVKTKFQQIGVEFPKLFEAKDIFGRKRFVKFEDLFDTSQFSGAEALKAVQKAFSGVENSFENTGRQIGSSVGKGFGDVFETIFSNELTKAMAKGLSGKALENFKAGLTIAATLSVEAFAGFKDSIGNLVDTLLQGGDAMKSFGESIKNTFRQIAVQIVKTIVVASILSAITKATGGGGSLLGAVASVLGGSHEKGLKKVPKDGYIAELHKDEMVVPAKQAQTLRNVMNPDFSVPALENVSEITKVTGLNKTVEKISGSHFAGLRKVPYDGYIAEVHKDEMIVPAKQAGDLRKVLDVDYSIPELKNIKQSLSTSDLSNSVNSAVNIDTSGNSISNSFSNVISQITGAQNIVSPSVPGIGISSLSLPNISPATIPTINQTSFSKINSAADLLRDIAKPQMELDVNIHGEISHDAIVLSNQKGLKKQGLSF